MSALSDPKATQATSRPLVAHFLGIFRGCTHQEFVNIVNAAPFGACDLLILAFVHTVDDNGVYIAQFNNGRDKGPNGTPPDTDLERVALVVKRARDLNPAIKILVSLGYDPDDLRLAAKTAPQFAESVARLIDDLGLDGFDIDYEPPDKPADLVAVVAELKQSLRNKIFTITPAPDPPESVLCSFTYVMPQYYEGVPARDDDWYAKKLNSFDKIVYGLKSELDVANPAAYAIPARANGTAGLFAWRIDTDRGFHHAVEMRRLMANGTLQLATPSTDGLWQWRSIPAPIPGQPAGWIDIACAGVGTALQTVAVGSDFSLWVAAFAENEWQTPYNINRFVSGGPPGFTRVACSSVDGQSLQVVALGIDRAIYFAVRNAEGIWVPEFSKPPPLRGSDYTVDIACTGNGQGRLHLIAINDSRFLWQTTWYLNRQTKRYEWDDFRTVPLVKGQPWTFAHVACAATPKEMHIVACGQVPLPDPQPNPPVPDDPSLVLWHRRRLVNGNWQGYQKVMDLEPSCPPHVIYAACFSVENRLHVVAAATDYSLWHSVLDAKGKWQPFQCVAQSTRPNFVSLNYGLWTGEKLQQYFQAVGVQSP